MFCETAHKSLIILALCVSWIGTTTAQDTAFTFQGELTDNGGLANGSFNMEFSLWDASAGGNQAGSSILHNGVTVVDGKFTVQLDFGAAPLDNSPRWLEIDVAGNVLSPRTRITRAPYALQTRGIFVNDDLSFVGVGRTDSVTAAEVFGLYKNTTDFGGMYAETANGGKPFYGYATGGSVDAYHYYDDATSTWRLWAGANRLSVDRNTGMMGIGTNSPEAYLHVAPSLDFENPIVAEDFDGTSVFKVNWAGGIELGPRNTICALNVGASTAGDDHVALAWINSNSGVSKQRIYRDKVVFPSTGQVLVGRSDTITAAEYFGVHASVQDGEYGGMYISTFAEAGLPFYGYAAGETADMWTYYDGGTGDWHVYNVGNRLTVESSGQVGVGTINPAFTLEVNGSAGKPGGGSWSNSSDRRLKKNIAEVEGALDQLLKLRGVTFEYIDPKSINELSGERTGMIAQEVEQVFPDWVDQREDGFKAVTYRGFEALTVEALRELQSEKDAQIKELREQNEALLARLESLEQSVAQSLNRQP